MPRLRSLTVFLSLLTVVKGFGAGGMPQSVKSLLFKLEDVHSDHSTHAKAG